MGRKETWKTNRNESVDVELVEEMEVSNGSRLTFRNYSTLCNSNSITFRVLGVIKSK